MKTFYSLLSLISIVSAQALSGGGTTPAPSAGGSGSGTTSGGTTPVTPVDNSVQSCFQNSNVEVVEKYICAITCETKYYYQHTIRMKPEYECYVTGGLEQYRVFEAWHACPDVTATYTSENFDPQNHGNCLADKTDQPLDLGVRKSNQGICRLQINFKAGPAPSVGTPTCHKFTVLTTVDAIWLHSSLILSVIASMMMSLY